MDITENIMEIGPPGISSVAQPRSTDPGILLERVERRTSNRVVQSAAISATPPGYRCQELESSIRSAERARIARDIHDSTSQLLVLLELQIMRLTRSSIGNSDVSEITGDLLQTISQIHETVRAIGGPTNFAPSNLPQNLRSMVAEFASRARCKVSTAIANVPDAISQNVAETLFRVAQEALANASRHAHADHIELRLWNDDDYITLSVADDGVGVGSSPHSSSGCGILNMRTRLDQLGGQLAIRNCEPGTMIEARVSLRAQSEDGNLTDQRCATVG